MNSTGEVSDIYAPFIGLMSEFVELYSEATLSEYSKYNNNINHIYQRYDSHAFIQLLKVDIEGIKEFRNDIEDVKRYYIENIYELNDKTKNIPISPMYINVGNKRKDANKYSPYAILAYGYKIKVNNGNLGYLDNKRNNALRKASKTAHSGTNFIIMDISRTLQYKSIQMNSKWLISIVPKILKRNQKLVDNFVYDSLEEDCEVIVDIEQKVNKTWSKLTELLYELYIRGSIVILDSSDTFIIDWDLEEGKYSGVYHPRWRNTLITDNPTEYLLQCFEYYKLPVQHSLPENIGSLNISKRSIIEQDLTPTQRRKQLCSPLVVKSYKDSLNAVYSTYKNV